jgi:hypothetical protein
MSDVKEPFSKIPPSLEFIEALSGGGHMVADCELCGRVCFEDSEIAGDWEEGELEKLREGVRTEPDKYIPMDSVHSVEIGGKTGIVGCTCNGLRQYEDFIWGYRRVIMKFISAKIKTIVEEALEDEGAAEHTVSDLEQEVKTANIVRCPKCREFVKEILMTANDMCLNCMNEINIAEAKKREEKRILEEEAHRTIDECDMPF